MHYDLDVDNIFSFTLKLYIVSYLKNWKLLSQVVDYVSYVLYNPPTRI